MDIIDILNTSDFFGSASKKSKQALADICIPRQVSKNEMLFWEGDTGHSLYLLAHGAIRVYKTAPDGRETVIKMIQPGEIFAEVVMFEKDTYPANAEVLKPGLVYEMPKKQFHALLSDTDFRNDFILMLMKKQRYLANQLHYFAVYDVEERFVRFLQEHYGEKETYHITLSKKDIAAAIGTIPETMSRILTRLQKDGSIAFSGKTLTVHKDFWKNRK
jgi:CRP/FNR family transcriptional regulator